MEMPESVEREITEAVNKMLSDDTAIMVDGKPVSGEEILKRQVEQILGEAEINQKVVVLKDRNGYGVYLLAPDEDLSPFYLEETGRSYFFPPKSCPFCHYCGELLWDYSNGPYCFFCELGLDNSECGGMDGKCDRFVKEEEDEQSCTDQHSP